MAPDHFDICHNHALDDGSSVIDNMKLLPLQLPLYLREQKETTKGYVLLNTIFFQVAQSDGSVNTCAVVEQQAAGADVGRRALQASKTLGTHGLIIYLYHTALTVFLSWSWTEAICLDLA